MINWKIMVNGNDFLDEREKKNEEGEERAAEWQEVETQTRKHRTKGKEEEDKRRSKIRQRKEGYIRHRRCK